MNSCIVTQKDIEEGLKKLPLPENPVILSHSSLKSFGYVEGGAQAVISALMNVCGSKGTLVMPTLTYKSVNEEAPFFDVNETPSDTGYITEVFRKMPGVQRSIHLFSSLAAYGYHAGYITGIHDDTPCGPGSPYRKIIELKGASLFIGTAFLSNSLFHCAEEHVHPGYLKFKTIENVKVRDHEGKERLADFRRYDCAQTGIVRKLEKMEAVFRENHVLHEVQIGEARIMFIRAEDNFRLSCKVLAENPGYILGE